MALIFVVNSGNLINPYQQLVKRQKFTKTLQFYNSANLSYFYTNESHFNFSTTNSYLPFQGYIAFESKSKCPLAGRVITLKDESEVIDLRATYESDGQPLPMQICTWTFLGPKNYGFKFVIKNYSKEESFLVANSTADIITSSRFSLMLLTICKF